MAIEDAAVLGSLLSYITHKSQLPKLLKAYQDLRHGRATDNQLGSRLNQKLLHLADGPEQEARDAAMKSAMEAGLDIAKGMSIGEDEPGFKILKDEKEKSRWAYGYDAEADVENWREKNWSDVAAPVVGKN
jgi:salicylate hydroxylase